MIICKAHSMVSRNHFYLSFGSEPSSDVGSDDCWIRIGQSGISSVFVIKINVKYEMKSINKLQLQVSVLAPLMIVHRSLMRRYDSAKGIQSRVNFLFQVQQKPDPR